MLFHALVGHANQWQTYPRWSADATFRVVVANDVWGLGRSLIVNGHASLRRLQWRKVESIVSLGHLTVIGKQPG